jgi:hypothetical protein
VGVWRWHPKAKPHLDMAGVSGKGEGEKDGRAGQEEIRDTDFRQTEIWVCVCGGRGR